MHMTENKVLPKIVTRGGWWPADREDRHLPPATCYLLPATCCPTASGHLPCFQADTAQSLWSKNASG